MYHNLKIPTMIVIICLTLILTTSVVAQSGVFPPPTATHQAELPPIAQLRTANPHTTIPGRYIVVFKTETSAGDISRVIVDEVLNRGGKQPKLRYSRVFHGFSGNLPRQSVQALLRNPKVAYIEVDQWVTPAGEQSPAPSWGLDRIDQTSLPLNNLYRYANTGTGVNVYVIDTGIRYTHTDFEGRALPAFDAINDGLNGADCHGHGTHVAGIIGGEQFGVAKDVNLFSVRVIGCDGSGTVSDLINGVEWLTSNAVFPAVANASISTGYSEALTTAINASIAHGITYVAAAGNYISNACSYTPANIPNVITVGSTRSDDRRASTSNWGPCLDLFAPGDFIISTSNQGNNLSETKSGTSMASPHVAGVAALYLQSNPAASPALVAQTITDNATVGLVSDPGSDSPNLLLNSSFLLAPIPTATNTPWVTPTDTPVPPTNTPVNTNTASPVPSATPTPSIATATHTPLASATPRNAPCSQCVYAGGFLSSARTFQYRPGETPFTFGGGTLQGWLEGPSGTDFDLRLFRTDQGSWQTVGSSASFSSSEYIGVQVPAGSYIWRVYAYSGSGAYDFWMTDPGALPPSNTPTPTRTNSPTPSITPSMTPTNTSIPASATPTRTPTQTNIPASATPTILPNATLTVPSHTPTPAASATNVPSPTSSPQPTATATPADSPCTNCTLYTATLAHRTFGYQPDGQAFSFSGGYLQGWLEGPPGTDFDLRLFRTDLGSWQTVGNSASFSSSEYIGVQVPAGSYIWRIYAYRGSGVYQLWMSNP